MNIAIIGGGAAGMVAGVVAAGLGAEVTIFEHMPRMGKKLILTGSGKCNISNVDMDLKHFHGGDAALIKSVLEKCPPSQTLDFFEKIGICFKERKGGLYPYSEQASAVVDALRFAIRDRNIEVHTQTDIRRIEKLKHSNDRVLEDRFVIATPSKKLSFDRVILCCGSNVNRNTGSDGSGYELAKSLGHTVVKPLPALTYLTCEEDFYPSIAGIRTGANIRLYEREGNGKAHLLGSETGELQLTKSGISGVCVFNLSHMAIRALDEGKSVKAVIDLLPDFEDGAVRTFMEKRVKDLCDRTLEELFIGLLAKPLGILIIKRCLLDLRRKCGDLTDSEIYGIIDCAKQFETVIKGYGNLDNAQVAQGGVSLLEINDCLESRICSGLYFAGEILDVNGDCGGYNLQWAASSGMLAGREAAR